MKRLFNNEVKEGLKNFSSYKHELVIEEDLKHLPEPVKKYLNYIGIVGKEKTNHVCISFTGRIRSSSKSGWMNFRSYQYNFFNNKTRIFYITAGKMGIPAVGIHLYKNEAASMTIKLLGLFKIADVRGKEMDQSETVTMFNDMCFMAPSTLIDKNIKWNTIDEHNVMANFSIGKNSINAKLIFDDEGKLINFISNDRFETIGKTLKKFPWSTPVSEYKKINNINVATYAKTIYHHPNEDFCYGEFKLEDIKYNYI
jgi:hypothetical protein